MKWANEIPTVTGWYWFRKEPLDYMRIEHVKCRCSVHDGEEIRWGTQPMVIEAMEPGRQGDVDIYEEGFYEVWEIKERFPDCQWAGPIPEPGTDTTDELREALREWVEARAAYHSASDKSMNNFEGRDPHLQHVARAARERLSAAVERVDNLIREHDRRAP